MPLVWTLTIAGSAMLFALAAVFARPTWLKFYLGICFPLSLWWLIEQGHVPYWTRPISLSLQLAAVCEAICLMHGNCWSPRRRYLCAAFCALLAIGGTFAAVDYPGYPKTLWWAQLWMEMGATASLAACLMLWKWWNEFRPAGWTVGNVAIFTVYCSVEVIALLWPINEGNWISVDVTLALIQDCCLLWWIGVFSL